MGPRASRGLDKTKEIHFFCYNVGDVAIFKLFKGLELAWVGYVINLATSSGLYKFHSLNYILLCFLYFGLYIHYSLKKSVLSIHLFYLELSPNIFCVQRYSYL